MFLVNLNKRLKKLYFVGVVALQVLCLAISISCSSSTDLLQSDLTQKDFEDTEDGMNKPFWRVKKEVNGMSYFDNKYSPLYGIVPIPENLDWMKLDAAFQQSKECGSIISFGITPGWNHTSEIDNRECIHKLSQQYNLDWFLTYEVFNYAREDIENLPSGWEDKRFSDPMIQEAFLREVLEIQKRYSPKYLMLGMEVNGYYTYHPEDFDNYVAVCATAYDALKAIDPSIIIGVTCMYEVMAIHNQWDILDKFGDKVDMFAFTSYPEFYSSEELLPSNYYDLLLTEVPTGVSLAISELGYSDGTSGGATTQASFLSRFSRVTRKIPFELIIWNTLHNLEGDPYFGKMGLIDSYGSTRPIYDLWRGIAQGLEGTIE